MSRFDKRGRGAAFPKIYFNVAEISRRRWLEEGGQRLENVDRTHLVLAAGKLLLQNRFDKLCRNSQRLTHPMFLMRLFFPIKGHRGRDRAFADRGRPRGLTERDHEDHGTRRRRRQLRQGRRPARAPVRDLRYGIPLRDLRPRSGGQRRK